MKLRDYVQDLNQEKNFEDILEDFLQAYKKASSNPNTNDKRILSLIQSIHTEAELREIIKINLQRLDIKFSSVANNSISGSSDDFELMSLDEIMDWWAQALGIDDKSEESDNTSGLNYDNDKDAELDRIMDEMDK